MQLIYPYKVPHTFFILCLLSISASVSSAENLDTNPLLRTRNDYNTSCGLESNFQSVLQFKPSWKLRNRASLPVANPTKSFWLDTPEANPLAEEGSAGILTQDADVCVIGSGLTGVSTAWHLSKMLSGPSGRARDSKASVLVLEARQFCSGATGRNGGHLTRNMFSSFLARQATYNATEAVKSYVLEKYTADSLVNFIKENNLESEVDLVEGGHVTVLQTAKDEMDARTNWEAAKAAGLPTEVKWIGKDEMVEKYGLDRGLNYTGVFWAGHNLWPCKLVTHLFKDSQSTSKDVDVTLHTKTPVTEITRNQPPSEKFTETPTSGVQHRRWTLHTSRGGIGCTYVVHATNAYASHLLPFLSGIEVDTELFPPSSSHFSSSPSSGQAGAENSGEEQLDQPQPHSWHQQPSRGIYGIIPTRGQVGAVRASVNSPELGWRNSWGSGGGWEYWFPRYQDASPSTSGDNHNGLGKNPLIILGGGRQFSGGILETGVVDDSEVNPLVSEALRDFLPGLFPGRFFDLPGRHQPDEQVESGDGWEMEWTGIMGFTKGGDPFVGPVGSPQELNHDTQSNVRESSYEGQYIAAGYTGHGMPRAYACAELVAGMIKSKITGEKWARPSWVPERYLTWATRP